MVPVLDPVGVGRRRGDGVSVNPALGKGLHPVGTPSAIKNLPRLTPSSVVPRKGRRGQPTGSYLCQGGLYLRPAQTRTPRITVFYGLDLDGGSSDGGGRRIHPRSLPRKIFQRIEVSG